MLHLAQHRSLRPHRYFTLSLLIFAWLMAGLPAAQAAPFAQDDPATQCAKGVQLYLDGQATTAFPLLESGFAGRTQAKFVSLDALGKCALALGILRNNTGDHVNAMVAFNVALESFEQSGERRLKSVVLNYIGLVYDALGHFSEALDHYQQALDISREINDPAGEAAALNNIGAVDGAQRHYSEALDHHQQALNIQRKVNDHPGAASTLNNIGAIYKAQGRYSEALKHYQQALDIFRAVNEPAGQATILNNIGAVYRFQGLYSKALDQYKEVLIILREIGDYAREGVTLNNVGRLYQEQGDLAEALAQYASAMTILETVRASAGSEQARAGFIGQYSPLYTNAALLYHQQGQDELAFLTSERGRARAFLDSLTTGYIQLSDQEAQELLVAEQETYAARQAAQDALVKARAANPTGDTLVANLEQQLAAAEQAHSNALKAIEAHGDQLATLIPSRSKGVLTVAEIQALLDPQTTLVSFFVADDQTLAFVLTRNRFVSVPLPVKRVDFVTQIQSLRAFANTEEVAPASARQLYAALITPLRKHLTTRHLMIVPHDVLHYLPFAALSDGEGFLIDNYTITVLPSASSLPFIKQNGQGRTPSSPLNLGNPATNEPTLKPLSAAEEEARTIANLYAVKPMLRAAATESLFAQQVGQAGIVHLAAHGSFSPIAPLASAIYLAPDPLDTSTGARDTSRDGRLEVGEIYGLNLHQADLVVLSACETQLGELSAGDELVGLTRAFFFAGTPSVIATLWSVDDKTTALLMARFYTHLRAGMGKAEALRQAQQDVHAEHPNPYYWAGFVLSGDPGSISVTPGSISTTPARQPVQTWPWLGPAAILVVSTAGVGVVLWHRAKHQRHRLVMGYGMSRAAMPKVQPSIAPDEPDDLLAALLDQASQQDRDGLRGRQPRDHQ
jgi:CHAT domain-containing protein/Tfp pilus assembly protein PilF